MTDRYLSDLMLKGKSLRRRTQYALYAAACPRAGLLRDLVGEAGHWKPRLWTYAVSEIVLYTRAAADRTDRSVAEVAQTVAGPLHLPLPVPQPPD